MGDEKSAIQRLNTAQAFNALGSLAGMLVAITVHQRISPIESYVREQLPEQQFNIVKNHDLGVLVEPYYYIAAVVIILMVVIYLNHLPRFDMPDSHKRFTTILSELLQKKNYREGVLAEFFYVGAQSACWMYIILYGTRIFVAEGLTEQEAEVMSQKYNIVAIAFFACSRFICSWLMNWFSPARMLSTMGIIGIAALIGVIFFTDRNGIYCLVTVSICLSLMFPTIYGLALQGIGENIKIAGAGLIMAILGGSFFPPIQAAIIQSDITVLGLPSTNLSFLIPLLCLAMIVWYAHRAYVRHSIQGTAE
jgi:FHS family L-fucose permease-like MFS transporter